MDFIYQTGRQKARIHGIFPLSRSHLLFLQESKLVALASGPGKHRNSTGPTPTRRKVKETSSWKERYDGHFGDSRDQDGKAGGKGIDVKRSGRKRGSIPGPR
jgi:hypothetical protein